MNPIRRLLPAALALMTGAALVVALPAGEAVGKGGYRQWVWTIAPGLTLRRIVDIKTPERIFVLTVDLSQEVTTDVALARDQLGVLERTSSMAERHGALAAINGDFGSFSKVPTHPFAEDGNLVHSSRIPGIEVAVSADEQNVFIDQPKQTLTAALPSGETLRVDKWNDGPPGLGEISAFTPAGGTLEEPPPFACSVRLIPTGAPQPLTPDPGVATDYTVDLAACSAQPMEPGGGIVLSAVPATDEAVELLSLTPAQPVRITWSFGWPDVLDAIGGVPLLVADGQVVATDCPSSFCRRNPRTGVGVTADGQMLLVVVDGRQSGSGYSAGMSLVEFAQLFVQLGAVRAVNLDGGGSSTMVVKGEVQNRPSDGFERSVGTALLVLPGPDAGPAKASAPSATRLPAAPGGGSRAALLDPGSTGGMLNALVRGQLGQFGPLSPDLLRIVRRFRALR